MTVKTYHCHPRFSTCGWHWYAPGWVVTKDELINEIWPDTFVEETNLKIYVSTLRKALGETGSGFIETLPRRGYRFTGTITQVVPDQPVIIPELVMEQALSWISKLAGKHIVRLLLIDERFDLIRDDPRIQNLLPK